MSGLKECHIKATSISAVVLWPCILTLCDHVVMPITLIADLAMNMARTKIKLFQ